MVARRGPESAQGGQQSAGLVGMPPRSTNFLMSVSRQELGDPQAMLRVVKTRSSLRACDGHVTCPCLMRNYAMRVALMELVFDVKFRR